MCPENDDFINKYNANLQHLDDFTDEETQVHEQITSTPQDNKYALRDEETDEDNNKNDTSDDGVWVNINDLHHGYPEDWATKKNTLTMKREKICNIRTWEVISLYLMDMIRTASLMTNL